MGHCPIDVTVENKVFKNVFVKCFTLGKAFFGYGKTTVVDRALLDAVYQKDCSRRCVFDNIVEIKSF